jgi:predicted DNA-binding transcriptional regulator AlpA
MHQQDDSTGRRYLPDPQVCRRYGVTAMTLWRWDHDPSVNFPKPIRINRRKYRDEAELEAWERQRAALAHGEAA